MENKEENKLAVLVLNFLNNVRTFMPFLYSLVLFIGLWKEQGLFMACALYTIAAILLDIRQKL